ncbi:esterase-like activity of phytase family protein [Methylobacter sp. S3L5C]|uniref:esterase-like activity of phytase family protein n=1 Tax=Methylobacter sp. S3L5C TaxID=2839024 RepID=UPI001FAE1433|nr:esterase-like activity of phytase family protein [Methylobacter sp. S3L5C]UOA10315.1 esterase-like activity of phytase family protein [Methylobacter sp. S3L5C]
MHKKLLLSAIIASLCAATSAHAAITSGQLIAIGSLSGSSAGVNTDLSGLTGLLENGIAGNFLGGIGSGLAYAGGNTFIATPDRGPNATAYNSQIDDTSSYIARFHTITLDLTANTSGTGLAYNLTPTLTATTLLSSATTLNYGTGAGLGNQINGAPLGSGAPILNTTNNTNYFTGRSDNYGSANALGVTDSTSANPSNARFDPEGVRVSNDGKSVFISDEYGPYVNQFDRATGERIKSFALPANLAVANLNPIGATEIANNTTSGRVTNKGMEGLAITPDGTMLVGIMQAALGQEGGGKSIRIVTIDIASEATHEYAYKLTNGSGASEIIAINNHEFLIDERDGKGLGDGSNAVVKQLYKIDLTGATEVSGMTGSSALGAAAIPKTLFLDVAAKLNANGINSANVPSKIEALAFGQDIYDNGALFHTLYVANDNDFVPGLAGANQFYVFAVADTALNFQAQQISAVPVPAAAWLFGTGLLGLMTSLRKRVRA